MFNNKYTKREIKKAIRYLKENRDYFAVSKMQRDLKLKNWFHAWAIAEELERRGYIGPHNYMEFRKVLK